MSTALDLCNSLHLLDKNEIIEFVMKCQHKDGGFGASVGYDPHMLYTLSAVQV